jgi:hypothetical protein
MRSGDEGAHWGAPRTLGGTLEVGGQRFKTAHNASGTLCLTWEGPNALREKRADVFASCSQDHGRTWPERPTRLDSNTPWLSHSLAPSIALDAQGNALVAWQDSRHIRPNIYVNFSRDRGRSWSAVDLRLDTAAGRVHSTYPSVASAGGGRFVVVWRTKSVDGPEGPQRLSYSTFTLPGVPGSEDGRFPRLAAAREAPLTAKVQARREARLGERVEAYWHALEQEDFATAFSLMDPFYRARSNMMVFGSGLSQERFLDHQPPASLELRENTATLTVKVETELKRRFVQGEAISQPSRTLEARERWVWVDGDWYRVFQHQRTDFLPL